MGCLCEDECEIEACDCMQLNRECHKGRCLNCSCNSKDAEKYQPRLIVGKSYIASDVAGLFTLDFIPKNSKVLQYTGKVKPDDGRDQTHLSWYMQSRINELCDRQYGFELDKRTDVDAADVGGIMRFANHACHST